jgi:carboxyl-terminal processing protease
MYKWWNSKSMWKSLVVSGLLLGLMNPSFTAYADDAQKEALRFQETLSLLSSYHVSGTSATQLTDTAIKAMVESLKDPYTVYMSASEYKQFSNSLEQRYVGIGIRFDEMKDAILVTKVFEGSPAESAGLLIGDRILEVDGKRYVDTTAQDFVNRIRGEENTTVQLIYERSGERRKVSIVRKTIVIPTVVSTKLEKSRIGYIKLTSFSADADEQFVSQLKNLGNLSSLIIDIRDNPGGFLDTASQIAKQFIKSGVLIHTSDRYGKDDPILIQNGSQVNYPVYILVNENSASASEVLAGALQDYKIATVVGKLTYGKGSVQQIFPLFDGGMLKVTIEKYYTPSKKQVDQVGIRPNVELEGSAQQLLTAFRLAGMSKAKIQRTTDKLIIDGSTFSDSFPIVEVEGQTFVPARILGAVLGANVNWYAEGPAIELVRDSIPSRFLVDGQSSLIQNQTGFLNMAMVQQAFPTLSWNIQGDTLTIVDQ